MVKKRVDEKKNEGKKYIKKYFEWDTCPKIYKIKITIALKRNKFSQQLKCQIF